MAEEKKAFVAYVDWESQFNLLSDEEAGKLIKHIFSYVNDRNPEFDSSERLLIMAFEPIKKQLKRDLKKYEAIKKKRSEAGKRSAEIKAQQIQQVLTSVDFVESKTTHVNKAQQASTNSTVTVTDIVKDTVIDTVTDKDSVINNNTHAHENFKFSHFGKQPISDLKKNCATHSSWLEMIAMKNSISMEDVVLWFDAFCLHLGAIGKTEETEKEFKRYCASWIASELRQGRKPRNENKAVSQQKVSATEAMQQSLMKKYGKHV